MRALAGFTLVTLAVAGCSSPSGSALVSPSPAGSASASASPPSTDPSLKCNSKPVPGHPLVLISSINAVADVTVLGLAVLDAADPLKPVQVCGLNNADGGRFISATKIAFWHSTFAGTADLVTGRVSWSRAFANPPDGLVFSPDGAGWAYQSSDAGTGMVTHLVVGGKDRLLQSLAPGTGQAAPPWGPINQLEFSATGKYLLTYTLFADPAAPNFSVYALDGSAAFRSSTAHFGVWDRTGDGLYFLAATAVGGRSGVLSSWGPGGSPVALGPQVKSYFWPAISVDRRVIVFNSYDRKGAPHLWGLDLGNSGLHQLSTSSSTTPVFVGPNLVWSSEEKPAGASSAPDGNVVAHDLATGSDTLVGDFHGFTPDPDPTKDILDVWLG